MCSSPEDANTVMWYATQARDSYPYYQHTAIGYNYRMSQPVYASAPAYVNGVSEAVFKVGMCLPAGPYVSDEDVRYIVECIKEARE